MHIASVSSALAAVVILTACRHAEPRVSFDADTAAIRQLYREWPKSVEAADVAQYVTFLDDSITLLIPGAPPVHGVAAYREALTPMFQAASYRAALTPPNKLEVAGPWAFAQYEGQVTTLPTGSRDVDCLQLSYRGSQFFQTGTFPVMEGGKKVREVTLEEVWRRIEKL